METVSKEAFAVASLPTERLGIRQCPGAHTLGFYRVLVGDS